MYKTVVFDLDGTLLNTLEDLTDAVLYIQKKFDFPLHNIGETTCGKWNKKADYTFYS